MKNQFYLSRILLCSGVLAFATSPAYADPACDAEVVAIQAALNAPAADISAADLEQAAQLFNVLSRDCAADASIEGIVEEISNNIRTLLGMGGRP